MFAFSVKRALGSPSRIVVLRGFLPSVRYESSSTPATSGSKSVTATDAEKEKLLKKFESEEMLAKTKRNDERMERFEKCREIFYGPERDYENFPTPKLRENYPPLKHYFIPQRWFDLMYNKTGVTGPYVLVGALGLYAFSKEHLMFDTHVIELTTLSGTMFYLLFHRFATRSGFNKYLDSVSDKHEEIMYTGPVRKAKELTEKSIDTYNQEINYMKDEDFVDQVYEENLGLMLEAEYRKRLGDVHNEVKRRLDYQLELQNTRRRFEQEHMVRWITDNVLKSITPQLEKDSIKSCITTLNSLAKTAKVV